MLRILIADDHDVVRRGLQEILQDSFPNLTVGHAASSPETLRSVDQAPWDLVLLDIFMPGAQGTDLLAEIKRHHPGLPVLILTAANESEFAIRSLQAGASGFVNKADAAAELITAIRLVLSGATYLNPQVAQTLAANLHPSPSTPPHTRLSQRELQVFRLIAEGRSVKEIASTLGLSDKTVGTYLARIREKTGLASHVEITRYAFHSGLTR